MFEEYIQDYIAFPFALGCRGLIVPCCSRCPTRPSIQGNPIILCCARGQINDCRFFPDIITYQFREGSSWQSWLTQIQGVRRAVKSNETSHSNRIAEFCSPTACRDTVCPAKASLQLCWEHPSSSPNQLWKAASAVRLKDTLLSVPRLPFSKIRKKVRKTRTGISMCWRDSLMQLLSSESHNEQDYQKVTIYIGSNIY